MRRTWQSKLPSAWPVLGPGMGQLVLTEMILKTNFELIGSEWDNTWLYTTSAHGYQEYPKKRNGPGNTFFFNFEKCWKLKSSLVGKARYAPLPPPHSPQGQGGLAYGVHDANIEDGSVLPHIWVSQGGSYETRGVATKLVDMVEYRAHVIGFLHNKQIVRNIPLSILLTSTE